MIDYSIPHSLVIAKPHKKTNYQHSYNFAKKSNSLAKRRSSFKNRGLSK